MLLAVIPALAAVLYFGLEDERQAGVRARAGLQQLTDVAARDHGRAIEAGRQLLLVLSELAVVRSRSPVCNAVAARVWRQYPRYANIGVVAADGTVFCSALEMDGSRNARDSSWFRRTVEAGAPFVSGFHYGGISGRPVMTLSQPGRDASGRIEIVAFASLDLGWLANFAAQTGLPPGSELSVIDPGGVVLAQYPDPEFWIGQDISPLAVVRSLLAGRLAEVSEQPGLDGHRRLHAHASLDVAGLPSRAHLIVGIPTDVAYAEARANLRRNLLVLAALALLSLGAAWWGSELSVVRRIRGLLAITRRFTAGDLDARTGMAGGAGELDQLGQAFDRMAETLSERERALRAGEAHLRAIIEAEPECVMLVAADGAVLQINPTGLGMIEAERPDQVIGIEFAALVVPEQRGAWRAFVESVGRGQKGRTEFEITGLRGRHRWLEAHAAALAGESGGMSVLAVVHDVSERRAQEARLNYMAHYDALTGLPNRMLFADRLQQSMIEADRRERLVGVLFLDLDGFKTVNDSLGHDAGDQVLKSVSERLRGAVRKGDSVSRLSGDEFAIVLADLGHVDDAARVARKILEVFGQPFHVEGQELYMTASLGITLYPLDERNVQGLLRDADVAMYRAKEGGRNNYAFYTAEMTDRATRRLALEGALRRALETDELYLVYQPIVDCRDRRVTGAEALLRWRHPERGMIAPGEFIPLAEETGLILRIGEWVLRRASLELRTWRAEGLPPFRLAVNFSPRQFQQRDLARNVLRIIESAGLDPGGFGLELTEGAVMRDPEASIGILSELGEAGLELSIDDFGTGYSSLSMLKRLPIDHLKIDRSFVREVTTDPDDAALVSAITTMARQLDLGVIAEGVETADQLRFLRASGCEVMQGYYFSEPLPAAELAALLRRRIPATGDMHLFERD